MAAGPGAPSPTPGVTVLLASYDGGLWIDEQLASIAAQTVQPAELVVTDDGSRDDTVARVEAFAATAPFEVRVLRRDAPLGYSGNFLAALGEVRGSLVAFCDQDDVWYADKLARCAAPFAEPDVTLVSHGSVFTHDDLTPMPTRRHSGVFARGLAQGLLHTELGSHLLVRTAVLHRFRATDLPRSATGATTATHDEWVTLVARAAGRLVRLPQPLISYRRHPRTVSPDRSAEPRTTVLSEPQWRRDRRAAALRTRADYLRREAAREPRWRERIAAHATAYDVALARELRRPRPGGRPRELVDAVRGGAYVAPRHGGSGVLGLLQDARDLRG